MQVCIDEGDNGKHYDHGMGSKLWEWSLYSWLWLCVHLCNRAGKAGLEEVVAWIQMRDSSPYSDNDGGDSKD